MTIRDSLDMNEGAIKFMETRRSTPTPILSGPVPNKAQLMELLTLAARVPDHGKLEPWRFIVIEKGAMTRLAQSLVRRGADLGKSESLVAKAAAVFGDAQLIVAVIESPDIKAKIPRIEQTLSAGALCLSLLNAALASGWGATWVTGFGAHDPLFGETELGIKTHERVAGFIHIGTPKSKPAERPRPNISAITEWMTE